MPKNDADEHNKKIAQKMVDLVTKGITQGIRVFTKQEYGVGLLADMKEVSILELITEGITQEFDKEHLKHLKRTKKTKKL